MNAFIVAAPFDDKRGACVRDVCSYLANLGFELTATPDTARDYSLTSASTGEFYALLKQADFVVAFGGDGYMLHAAKHAADASKNILCINCGRMGYLAAMESGEVQLLDGLAKGDFSVQKRYMLRVEHLSNGEQKKYYALNDAVLGSGNIAKTVELAVSCQGRDVMRVKGDGVIFSTPTGSTAYSFSAGGPVIDPEIDCITLTPICPHFLAPRSLIFGSTTRLTADDFRGDTYLTVDGEQGIPIWRDDTVTVSYSDRFASFIKLKPNSFFDIFHSKFNPQQ